MNKVFYFLLFCSVSGAGVLWWLMTTVGIEETPLAVNKDSPTGLKIEESPSNPIVGTAGSQEAKALETQESSGPDLTHGSHLADSEAASTGQDVPSQNAAPVLSEQASRLSMSSEPPGVSVFLDGSKIGVTPMERTLTSQVQKFRFEKEGFVPVEREAPAEKTPEGAYLSWRISMVPQQLPAAEKNLIDSVESYFLKGVSGPVFVQVKAISSDLEPRSSVVRSIQEMRQAIKEDKVFGCEVSLGDKGQWYRLLIGPFSSKAEAATSMSFLKESLKVEDLFVTGAQSCL